MIDGVKCSCVGLDADLWRQNPLLDFGLCISESTGELLTLKREANARSLKFVISPHSNGGLSCSILGSLHKYKNNNGTNWNNFTFTELLDTLGSLQREFNIDLSKAQIHSIEMGVNIQLDYKPEIILRNVVCHKGKGFDSLDRKDRKLGLICVHTDYAIKLYDKGYQSKIAEFDKYVFRYELKINRQRVLEPFGISTLSDLMDVEKVTSLVTLLIDRLNEIVFFDYSYKGTELTECKHLNWERYSNPKYWESLDRKSYYKARKRFAELLKKYGCIDWQQFVLKQTTKTWYELSQIKQIKGRQFPHYFTEVESSKRATFSNLEYLVENVTAGDVLRAKRKEQDNSPSYCISCGRQITEQKRGSLFCSERIYGKDAKRCRNKDSNRRLTMKRKIFRAMNKDLMLRITYRDKGVDYTDTLAVNEISITREWLDRVIGVDVLEPQQTTLTNKEAKKYLNNLSKSN